VAVTSSNEPGQLVISTILLLLLLLLTNQGSGVYFDDEGSSYEGEFLAGMRHGRGRAVAATLDDSAGDGGGGDVYEGCWLHDKR
jgi:hypothetical protein